MGYLENLIIREVIISLTCFSKEFRYRKFWLISAENNLHRSDCTSNLYIFGKKDGLISWANIHAMSYNLSSDLLCIHSKPKYLFVILPIFVLLSFPICKTISFNLPWNNSRQIKAIWRCCNWWKILKQEYN